MENKFKERTTRVDAESKEEEEEIIRRVFENRKIGNR